MLLIVQLLAAGDFTAAASMVADETLGGSVEALENRVGHRGVAEFIEVNAVLDVHGLLFLGVGFAIVRGLHAAAWHSRMVRRTSIEPSPASFEIFIPSSHIFCRKSSAVLSGSDAVAAAEQMKTRTW